MRILRNNIECDELEIIRLRNCAKGTPADVSVKEQAKVIVERAV